MEDEVLLLVLRHLDNGYQGFLLMESEMNKVLCLEMRATPSILAVPKVPNISEE